MEKGEKTAVRSRKECRVEVTEKKKIMEGARRKGALLCPKPRTALLTRRKKGGGLAGEGESIGSANTGGRYFSRWERGKPSIWKGKSGELRTLFNDPTTFGKTFTGRRKRGKSRRGGGCVGGGLESSRVELRSGITLQKRR